MKICERAGCDQIATYRFCSKACSNSAIPRKKKKNPVCNECGIVYQPSGRCVGRRFCTRKCMYAYELANELTHPCSACGENAPISRKTCSESCHSIRGNASPRGGISRVKPIHKTCESCKATYTGVASSKFCSTACRQTAQRKPIEYHVEKRRERSAATRAKKALHSITSVRRQKITKAQRESMYQKQKGLCAIKSCQNEAKVLDHCHISGKIRGLLCYSHNTAFGAFNDSIACLEFGIEYLKKYL